MKQPNILLFLPDGLQARLLDPDSPCATPNVDRVAAAGTRFDNTHTPSPVCSPARASLMTGLLPHNHGVLQVEHCVDDDQCRLRTEHRHWAQSLSAAGYDTAYFGKWHIERSNRLEDFGWRLNGCDESASLRDLGAGVDDTEALLQGASHVLHLDGPDGYRPVMHWAVTPTETADRAFARTTDRALDYLASRTETVDPWACVVSFAEPNVPLVAGQDAFEAVDREGLPLPGSLNDALTDAPGFYRRQRRIFDDITAEQWRDGLAIYSALTTELDRQLGRLLDALQAAGTLDETIVVVVSDHGRYLGAHGMDNHNFGAYEEIYRVPLIVSGPGVAAGRRCPQPVMLHDLAPTLTNLAGADPVGGADSIAFDDLLADPSGIGRRQFGYAEFFGTRFLMTQRIVWRGTDKLVFNGFDEDELYDLAGDPDELSNIAQRHPEMVVRLMADVWDAVEVTGDAALSGTHYAPMRIGAIGPDAAGGA